MKKFILILIILSFNNIKIDCQTNHVLNGSFENPSYPPVVLHDDVTGQEVTYCLSNWYDFWTPQGDIYIFFRDSVSSNLPIDTPAYLSGWYIPTKGTSDYFHLSGTNGLVQWPTNGATNAPENIQNPKGGDGYCGIYLRRKFIPNLHQTDQFMIKEYWWNLENQKNEYLQQKLATPLQPGSTYIVSFYCSRAFGPNLNTGHYIKDLGAYLSTEPIIDTESDYPINISINDPHLVLSEFPLYDGGGPTGNNWMLVEGTLTVTGNEELDFITIGNFKEIWLEDDIKHRTLDSNEWSDIRIYYFIDSVSVVSKYQPSCVCPNYEINIFPPIRPLDSNEDVCCGDIWIRPIGSGDICQIDGLRFRAGNDDWVDTIYPSGTIPLNGDFIYVGSYCLNQNDVPIGSPFNIHIQSRIYGENKWACDEIIQDSLKCPCKCPTSSFDLSLDYSETSEQCCWEIKLNNNLYDCDLNAPFVGFSIDPYGLDPSLYGPNSESIHFIPEPGWELNFDGNEIHFIKQDGFINHTSVEVIVGTICIDKNEIKPVIYDLSLVHNNGPQQTCEIINGELSCGCHCPDDLNDWLNIDVIKPGEGCEPNQCAVTYDWNIPDSNDCFHFYKQDDGNYKPFSWETPPELDILPCREKGEKFKIKIELFRFTGDPNSCVIEKEDYCPVADIRGNCNPDSCEEDWNELTLLDTIDAGDCVNCKIFVNYKYRQACDSAFQDLQITKIEKICDTLGCELSNDSLYKLAVKKVAAQNDMDFEPKWPKDSTADSCSNIWRVSQYSCWFHWIYFDYIPPRVTPNGSISQEKWINVDIYDSCSASCCARLFQVCRQGEKEITMTDLGPYSEGDSCEGLLSPNPWAFTENDPDSLPCYFTCDFLKDIQEINQGNIPEIATPETEEENDFQQKGNSVFGILYDYYDNNILKIYVKETNGSNIDIKIYNLQGELLFAKSENLNKGLNSIFIDISSLLSGVYLYNISIDGINIKNAKISIVR
ncbi:MAG: T9SS type A sorting domain-containing protein [bacterium]